MAHLGGGRRNGIKWVRKWRWPLGCFGAFLLVNLWLWGFHHNDVLRAAYFFPDGGGYCRLSDSGVSDTIEHDGSIILPPSNGGTYCCGYTFQVAMRVARARGLLKGKTASDVRRFQKMWYGSHPGSEFKECAMAVEFLGIGREVPPAQARPGDFITFFNINGQGHSVVFLGWAMDAHGAISGLHFRSSQQSTDGIGDATRYFADSGPLASGVDRQQIAVARLHRAWWSKLLYPFLGG